jgi:hypothetical protein
MSEDRFDYDPPIVLHSGDEVSLEFTFTFDDPEQYDRFVHGVGQPVEAEVVGGRWDGLRATWRRF